MTCKLVPDGQFLQEGGNKTELSILLGDNIMTESYLLLELMNLTLYCPRGFPLTSKIVWR